MKRWVVGVAVAMVSVGTAPAAAHQPTSASAHPPISPSTQFLVFLHDGRVLHSHGECATLPDELVCVVKLGGGEVAESHDLLTVPLALVDQERTAEYARAVRAAVYGATRGEREYADLTADISRALAELKASTDRDRRLGIAQVARLRLANWSAEHFGYKAEDTRQLVSMLDEVIAELRVAAGDTTFSLDMVANLAPAEVEPLRPAPGVSEAVEASLLAAEVTRVAAERLAILRSAQRVAATLPASDANLKARVAAALEAEESLERRFRALVEDVAARADTAVRRGRPEAFPQLMREAETRHARLGGGRSREMSVFIQRLQMEYELAKVQRAALARWSQVRTELLAYEVRVRPVFDAWVVHGKALDAVRGGGTPRPAAIDAAARRFASLHTLLDSLRPVPELAGAHALLQSAVQMARQSLVLGQRLTVAANTEISRNAASAITGADLLLSQARADLIIGLYPRRVR